MEKRAKDDIILEQQRLTDEALELRFMDDNCASFKKTRGGFLSVEYRGKTYPRVAVCPSFPFTQPGKYISLREETAEGREIGMIEDLYELSADTQQLITEQINLRCFMPKITKIISVKEKYGFAYLDVDTDRGQCKFTVNVSSADIINLGGNRIIFKDVDGNRFEIPDTSKLSSAEYKIIEAII